MLNALLKSRYIASTGERSSIFLVVHSRNVRMFVSQDLFERIPCCFSLNWLLVSSVSKISSLGIVSITRQVCSSLFQISYFELSLSKILCGSHHIFNFRICYLLFRSCWRTLRISLSNRRYKGVVVQFREFPKSLWFCVYILDYSWGFKLFYSFKNIKMSRSSKIHRHHHNLVEVKSKVRISLMWFCFQISWKSEVL